MITASVLSYLSDYFKQPVTVNNFFTAGGGCINHNYQLRLAKGKTVFCKINSATNLPQLFQKERNGLLLIDRQCAINVPRVIDCTVVGNSQILVMEWVQAGERNPKFWERFGEQLARLHQVSNDQFGLDEDNFMGSVPQKNTKEQSWVTFFREHRLKPLVKECVQKGLLTGRHREMLEDLYEDLPGFFAEEKPALLHGDLWSGNFICNQHSEPVLIDPAVYFGHRSIDLAMSTLFGGFDKRFYQSYQYHFPFPANYTQQWAVCNLYPLLIHLLLFGTGYLHQIEETLGVLT
jgi:fructosamine-3-kinase